MAGRVAGLVDLHDGYLHQLHVCAGCAQQHGELVLVLIAGNLQQPVQDLRGEAAQTGLGICHAGTGRQSEEAYGCTVTNFGAQRHLRAFFTGVRVGLGTHAEDDAPLPCRRGGFGAHTHTEDIPR